MDTNKENKEVKLTALQRAKKKYYEKIKNSEEYKARLNTPEYIEKRRQAAKKFYDKVKNDTEFKAKVSEQKHKYYERKKIELLLEIKV